MALHQKLFLKRPKNQEMPFKTPDDMTACAVKNSGHQLTKL